MPKGRHTLSERSAPARRTSSRRVLGVTGALFLIVAGCSDANPENRVATGDVSAARRADVAASFQDVDVDRDNSLSRDEIRRWWRSRADDREFAASPRERTYLDAWDLNHDSRYDEDEVGSGFFEAFDTNRNDRIDTDEWTAASRDFTSPRP